MTDDERITLELERAELELELRRFHKIGFFKPYPKQMDFFAAGATHDERALIAANQVGKTMCGGFEDAVHLTGEYPTWWPGHRFDHPIHAWIAGPKADKVRDTTQAMLFGPWNKPDEFGSGFLPRDAIVGRPTLTRGVSGAYDTATVKWKDKHGRLDDSARSTITFMYYTEGQLAFASNTIDLFHGDEEMDEAIYSEARTRLQVRRGLSFLTLTPLLGRTSLIKRFLDEAAPNRSATRMGIYDALHYTKEQADAIVAGYPAHERNARAYGEPMLGEGRVFLWPEEQLLVPAIPEGIPRHWAKLWGIDFGINHPFAAALVAIDRELDTIYLVSCFKMANATKLQHIPRIRALGAEVPVAWPHDGHQRDKGSGDILADQYRNPGAGVPGLRMLPDHATWPDGGFSTEVAVAELTDRCETGRFLVIDNPENQAFLAEYRQYHRTEGQLVRVDDDILSALFKTLMMKRSARQVPLGPARPGGGWQPQRQVSTDFDVFTGQPIRTEQPRIWSGIAPPNPFE